MAFRLGSISSKDQEHLIESMGKYASALEQSRIISEQIKILRLTSSCALRKQIIHMIETIQINEFHIPITPDLTPAFLKLSKNTIMIKAVISGMR